MGNGKALFKRNICFFRDGNNHAATIFNRSQSAYLEKYARTEGMGSGTPIKFAGYEKSTKWVSSNSGESCFLFEISNKGHYSRRIIIKEVLQKYRF